MTIHPNPSTLPRLNESTILDLLGPEPDPAMLRDIAGVFFSDAPVQLARMVDALSAGDPATLERVAHSFRGSAYGVGADRLGGLCHALEDAAASHDVGEAADLIAECRTEYALVSRDLAVRAGLTAEQGGSAAS